MFRLYVRYELGVLPPKWSRELNKFGKGDLPNWKQHCRDETGWDKSKILMFRDEFSFLSDEELVTAIVGFAKDSSQENGTWTPEEPGIKDIIKKIEKHNVKT
jgi:hypothetical protein